MGYEDSVIATATASNTAANVGVALGGSGGVGVGGGVGRHQHPPYYYKAAVGRRTSAKLHESMLGGGSSLEDDDGTSAGSFGEGMSRFKVRRRISEMTRFLEHEKAWLTYGLLEKTGNLCMSWNYPN